MEKFKFGVGDLVSIGQFVYIVLDIKIGYNVTITSLSKTNMSDKSLIDNNDKFIMKHNFDTIKDANEHITCIKREYVKVNTKNVYSIEK